MKRLTSRLHGFSFIFSVSLFLIIHVILGCDRKMRMPVINAEAQELNCRIYGFIFTITRWFHRWMTWNQKRNIITEGSGKMKMFNEKTRLFQLDDESPWENQHTLRIDSWAGLIASSGSFFSMVSYSLDGKDKNRNWRD